MKKSKKGGNVYDRILKENTSAMVLRYMAEYWDLGVDLREAEPLPTKYSRTLEREVDYLYRVPRADKEDFILHLEFQTHNDAEMLERMQEYHGILYREFKMEVYHVLIYLGKDKMRMKTTLPPKYRFKGYKPMVLNKLDAKQLLSSQVPEVFILADHGKEPPEKVLRLIFDKLIHLVDHPDKRRKYFTQLSIMSSLRESYRSALQKMTSNMPIELDIIPEEDFMYKRAAKEWQAKLDAVKREAEEKEARLKRETEQSIIELFKTGVDKKHLSRIFNYGMADLEALLAEAGLDS